MYKRLIDEMIDTGTTLMISGKSFSINFNSDAFQSEIEMAIDHLKILLKQTKDWISQSYICKNCGEIVTIKDVDDFETAKQFRYCGKCYYDKANWGNE